MWFDPLMSFLLRSPLYPMLGDTMLITVTGCKTGKQYTTPVGYYREGNSLWIITSRDRTWWRNLRSGANVSMHLHGKDVNGFAEAVLDESTVAAQVQNYLHHVPMAAKSLGLRVENGMVNAGDAAQLAKERLFVRVCITAQK